MSNSKVSFNNITYRSDKNSILVGEVKINTPAPDSIEIPPLAESCTSHIVLQKGDDTNFKNAFLNAPVRSSDIYLYDQCGHMFSSYTKDRINNAFGTVKISADNKVLLSNIQLPTVSDGQVYLVINVYQGLNQTSIDSSKKFLVEKDLEGFSSKYDLSKVILFISSEISFELERLGVNYRQYFKNVHTSSSCRMNEYLCEYLAGRTVTGSKPTFQGMLTFGKDVDVVLARFSPMKGFGNISVQLRRNGRVQINSEDSQAAAYFFIMLKHESSESLHYTEDVTKSEFEIVNRTIENLPDLTDDHFNVLIDSIRFIEKLNANRESKEFTKIILENAVEVVKYQFDSPLFAFDHVDTESTLSQFVIDYARVLRNQIFYLIYNKASEDFTAVVRKPTKSVMFKDMEHLPFGTFGYHGARAINGPVSTAYNSQRDMTHAVSCAPQHSSLAPTYTSSFATFNE